MELLEIRNRWRILISMLFSVFVLSGMGLVWGMGKKGNSLMINKDTLALLADARPLPEGDGFLIHCSVKNLGNLTVEVLIMPSINVELQILSKEGNWSYLPSTILKDVRISKDSICTIKPSDAHSFVVRIDKHYFTWPGPGSYEARIVYENGLRKVEGVKIWTGRIESNTFQLEFR